jgi:hypothetical protein
MLVCAGAAAMAVALAYPSTGSAEWSFGLMPIADKKQTLTFNDHTRCVMRTWVTRSGGTAKSNGRFICSHPQKKAIRPLKVRMKTFAGAWLGTRGPMSIKTCKSTYCDAAEATYTGLKSNQRATSNLILDIYYPRNAAFFLPPPFCEAVKDPEGKGPPGYRITCAIQAR